MRIKVLTTAIISSLLLTACNDGSSSASSTQTGVLSDSYVKGVAYSAAPSGKTGATGTNGEFDYLAGDTVTFKIGGVTLGSVNMSNTALGLDSGRLMVRPKDLAGVVDETDEKALAVAQFIQTAAAALPSRSAPRLPAQPQISWARSAASSVRPDRERAASCWSAP